MSDVDFRTRSTWSGGWFLNSKETLLTYSFTRDGFTFMIFSFSGYNLSIILSITFSFYKLSSANLWGSGVVKRREISLIFVSV